MADVAQDASFLDTVDTPVLELHRSNLLKVEVGELLDETVLNLTPSDANVGWAAFARDYVANVATTIRQMPACTASSNESCPFYDKSRKITEVSVPANLNVDPIGSNGANCIGLTKTTGNANALPILDCAVILPNSMWNAKDYLHYRYFDVSYYKSPRIRTNKSLTQCHVFVLPHYLIYCIQILLIHRKGTWYCGKLRSTYLRSSSMKQLEQWNGDFIMVIGIPLP